MGKEVREASMSPVLIVMEDSEDEKGIHEQTGHVGFEEESDDDRSESLSWDDSPPLQRVNKNSSDETRGECSQKGKKKLYVWGEGVPPPRTAMELLHTSLGSAEEDQEENCPTGAESPETGER